MNSASIVQRVLQRRGAIFVIAATVWMFLITAYVVALHDRVVGIATSGSDGDFKVIRSPNGRVYAGLDRSDIGDGPTAFLSIDAERGCASVVVSDGPGIVTIRTSDGDSEECYVGLERRGGARLELRVGNETPSIVALGPDGSELWRIPAPSGSNANTPSKR